MDQLITIETVPISIEYVEKQATKSTPALSTAKLEVSRSDNRVSIRSDALGISADSFSRNLAGAVSYSATAGYDNIGNINMTVNFFSEGKDSPRYSQVSHGIEKQIASIPVAPAIPAAPVATAPVRPIRSSGGQGMMQINFDISRLPNVDHNSDLSFTPPELELKVTEYADVIIKYVGGPIYFPRSADPNYQPPATESTFDTRV